MSDPTQIMSKVNISSETPRTRLVQIAYSESDFIEKLDKIDLKSDMQRENSHFIFESLNPNGETMPKQITANSQKLRKQDMPPVSKLRASVFDGGSVMETAQAYYAKRKSAGRTAAHYSQGLSKIVMSKYPQSGSVDGSLNRRRPSLPTVSAAESCLGTVLENQSSPCYTPDDLFKPRFVSLLNVFKQTHNFV